MPFVALLGCDGSGKSAVIAGVSERLRGNGVAVNHGHWRPVAFRPGVSDAARATADDPHGQTPRGKLASIIKLGWLWINWWGGWFRILRCQSTSGVVLFDRYHADLLVDPLRYRYDGPVWLAQLASRLMPQPDLVVFLDADPDVLLSRKQEVSRDALAQSRAAYLKLATSHARFRIVNAALPLDQVIMEVCDLIGGIR